MTEPECRFQVVFVTVLLLCIVHYLFFSLLNLMWQPQTLHSEFLYASRKQAVLSCIYAEQASICGPLPEELGTTTNYPVSSPRCAGQQGLLFPDGRLHQMQTAFEAIESWCEEHYRSR